MVNDTRGGARLEAGRDAHERLVKASAAMYSLIMIANSGMSPFPRDEEPDIYERTLAEFQAAIEQYIPDIAGPIEP